MAEVTGLKTDYRNGIVGITGSPQFSWQIESCFRNCRQRAYQLQVSREGSFSSPLLDTGLVESGESAHVRIEGFTPDEGGIYYTRVRVVTDDDGEAGGLSRYSQPVRMVGGLRDPEVLKGCFITAERPGDRERAGGTYLRNELVLKGEVRSAVAYSTAQGLYQLHMNGCRASDDELSPGWTSYDHRLLYQSCVVTGYLHKGRNAVGAHLGAGWYKGDISFTHVRNYYGDHASLSFRLVVAYTDGTSETFYSDESWTASDSPVLQAEIYDGEAYDARLEQPGWDRAGFDDSLWRTARPVPCTSRLIEPQQGTAVRLIETVSPKLAFYTPKGERVIDFGQNMSALPEISGQGQAGDTIVLTCFEVLDAEGNVYTDNLREAKQRIVYIVKDDKPFTYRPHFTFFGFRFLHVESFCGRADLDNFTARVIHSDMEPTGSFECSNPEINQLQHNILWGLKSNFVDVPTDCPQRDERLGWTGDAQIFCRTACFNVNTYGFFTTWLRDLALDQAAAGGVPHVVPDLFNKYPFENWLLNQGTHSAAAWADAAVIIPWNLYLSFGDTAVLERQYGSMKEWVDFMHTHAVGNIWNYKLQFGDWVALDAEEGSYFGATPNDLTCTAYYAYTTGLFSKAARVLGKEEVADEYGRLHGEIVRAFRETFFDGEGKLTAQTQTAHILALHFDLVPEAYRSQTVSGLKRLLAEQDGHLVTGFVGTPYFCHALSANGCLKEAYELLLKDDFPSWLYQVRKGATTIWEHWDGIRPDGSMWSPGMNSFNHYAYGAVGEWLYRVVAGIEIDEQAPGYARSIIAPRIGGDLSYVKASYTSSYGAVEVIWEVARDAAHPELKHVLLHVSIPVNTAAAIRLTDNAVLTDGDGLGFSQQGEYLEAEAGSGRYTIGFDLADQAR